MMWREARAIRASFDSKESRVTIDVIDVPGDDVNARAIMCYTGADFGLGIESCGAEPVTPIVGSDGIEETLDDVAKRYVEKFRKQLASATRRLEELSGKGTRLVKVQEQSDEL